MSKILVGLLTVEQKDSLIGQQYTEDSFFNPIETANLDWIISKEEINQCTNTVFLWVKDLTLIDYEPKPSPPLPGME